MSGPALPVASTASVHVRTQTIVLVTLMVVAAALRLYHIDTTSLWTDELFTRYYAKTGLRYLWGEGLRLEPNPPLYYSLIALWERVAGDGAWALRLPSLLGSLASVGLAALIGRDLFSRAASTSIGVLLLVLAPVSIFYAQEARAYGLQGAALALALYGFARVLREPRDRAALALYAAGALLAIYLHATSVLAVAAFNGAALVSAVGRDRMLDRADLVRWVVVNAVVGLLCTPLLPALLSAQGGTATSWIPPLGRYTLELALALTLLGPALGDRILALGEITFVLLAVLVLLPPWRPGRRALTVLVLVPGIFLALMIGVSVTKPLLLSRTLAWLLVPLALVLGDVLARRVKVLAAGVLAAAFAATLLHLRQIDNLKEDWQGFLARLPGLEPPALVVMAPHTSPAALAVYAPQAQAVRLDGGFPPIIETMIMPQMFGTKTIQPSELRDAIAAGRPVWLIVRRPDWDWMVGAIADLRPPRMTVFDGEPRNPAVRALLW
ncbi:MAG: hypothetical protein NVSMB18_24910 [Acetobacteraceae bacterium]